MIEIKGGDFLAGGGGLTEAQTKVGIKMRWVLNHDPIAIRTNMHNHKGMKHFLADFYKQDEHEMEPVDFCTAGIECTQFSKAKGGGEKDIKSYMLGWELVRYMKHVQPLVMFIENVPEFKEWAPIRIKEDKKRSTLTCSALKVDENGAYLFEPNKNRKGEMFIKWRDTIKAMGYDYTDSIRNAADDGIPTRRVRYFAVFSKTHLRLNVSWPQPTHSKDGKNGLPKWLSCAPYIDLKNEGNSIFGRKLNPNVAKAQRKPLVKNSMKRIAGGIKKHAPELAFILQYYGSGINAQSVDAPLNTIRTKECHALITIEKKQFIADYYSRDNTAHSLSGPANTIRTDNSKHLVSSQCMVQHYSGNHSSSLEHPLPTVTSIDHNALLSSEIKFIADHCHTDNYNSLEEPLNPQLSRQTKQFISVQYNSNGNPEANNQGIDEPLKPITTERKHQFISHHFGSGVNQSINEPMNSITTKEKIQFISAYFSSSGKQESQNQSIETPLGTITTGTNKKALNTISFDSYPESDPFGEQSYGAQLHKQFSEQEKALLTAIDEHLYLDFDIKMRFLTPDELAAISTFPDKYFSDPILKLSGKQQTALIGKAVPPQWAEKLIRPIVDELRIILEKQEAV